MNVAKIVQTFVVFLSVSVYGADNTPPAIKRTGSLSATAAKEESPGRTLYRLIAAQQDGEALKLLNSGTIDSVAVNERLPEFPHTPTALHRAISRKQVLRN